ncbi:MAG: hypothetical protein JXA16_08250 [Bacteroidales bacterium]|nr:hypothetical protein [Bacteroidales bacterium]
MKKTLLIILGVLVVLIIAFLIWNQILLGRNEERACTMEAKLCPDGSYVGRVAPNCEFAECPIVDELKDWKTYTNEEYGFKIKYPENIQIERTENGISMGNPAVPYYSISVGEANSLQELKVSEEEKIMALAPKRTKVTWKDVNIGGENGAEMSYQMFAGGYDGLNHVSMIVKNGNAYIFSINYGNGTIIETEKEYSQILSTFKFID